MTETPERTALYRICGAGDVLLYIGISKDFGRRWKTEARTFPWWAEHCGMTVEWHDSRPEAEAAEEAAIKAEEPKYNKQHASPASARRPVRQQSENVRIYNEWAGTLVRDLRKARSVPQKALVAEMAGRGFPWYQATVYTVESGRRPMLFKEVVAIADIFGIAVDSFTPPWRTVHSFDGRVICGPIVSFPGASPDQVQEHAA